MDKGSVVDDQITSPEGNEFYLCAHKTVQGTACPSRYKIYYDDWNIHPNDLQVSNTSSVIHKNSNYKTIHSKDKIQPLVYTLCFLLQ